jgi:hypothetical protein
MKLTTKTKSGTVSMSNPHSFKNSRAVTEEERKRQTHYDKRVSHDQELLREQQRERDREQQIRENEARERERDRERERERREAERRSSSQYIPTGPSGRGYSGGHHQQSRSFHARDSLSSTTVAPSPRDRGVFDRDGPLVVTVPAHDNSRRNSEQFSPLRHRLAPKPVVGEKNELETVPKDLHEEEKLARMLKSVRSSSCVEVLNDVKLGI